MSKTPRVLIAVALLAMILFLGRNQIARAGAMLVGPKSEPMLAQHHTSGLFAEGDPGTVQPPPAVALPITGGGTYSVGGICTFRVIELAEGVTLQADVLPYETLGIRPQKIASYLAGVCRGIYTKVGVGVIDLAASDGRVDICFAAVPNTTGKMYVYNDKAWTALDTTTEAGLACAPAQQTGKYVLVTEE